MVLRAILRHPAASGQRNSTIYQNFLIDVEANKCKKCHLPCQNKSKKFFLIGFHKRLF
jgi:hypothetical protein